MCLSSKKFKMWYRKACAGVIAAVMLTGCGNSAAPAEESAAKVDAGAIIEQEEVNEDRTTTENSDGIYEKLVYALSSDPQDIAPFNVNSGSRTNLIPYIYESLFDCDATHYYPVLAKSYTETDPLYWDVELYDYIKDSEGNPIDAYDVVYCYDNFQASGTFLHADMYDHVEATGDYTLRFYWTREITGVCDLEWAFCKVPIYNQEAYENGKFETAPVATGPYCVKSFTAGSGVVLERNENYWQTDESLIIKGHHANVQTIEFPVISETSQQIIALQNGTIDFSSVVPTENLQDFIDGAYSEQCSVTRAPSNGYFYIMGNMSDNSIWSDVNFRKAVFYALDNEAIGAAVNYPAAEAIGTPMWPEFYDAMAAEETYVNTYDLTVAKEYLDKSAYNGEEVTLLLWNATVEKDMGPMIQSLLGAVGINVTLRFEEQSQGEAILGTDSGYDFFVSAGGGSSLIGGLNRMINNSDYANGMALGCLYDETLFEKYNYVNNAKNFTVENTLDLMHYVYDNAYLYAMVYEVSNRVYSSDIAELGTNYAGLVMLGDCVFYLD